MDQPHNDPARVPISFVVPVYSGEDYLRKLVSEIGDLASKWRNSSAPMYVAEICLVDDGAIDGSPVLVDHLAAENPIVKAYHLSRNFGQHPATMAGISRTTGDWIVTLDEDLQHPPAKVPDLLERAVTQSADLVYANAEGAVHQNLVRDLGSRGYKALMEKVSGNANIRIFNSFRLIRGPIARAAAEACGHDTYFDIALSWFTQRVSLVEMQLKDERFIQNEKSGYRFGKLISHARRMMMSAGAKPLRLAGLAGLSISALTLLAGIILFAFHFLFPGAIPVQGWTSLVLTTALFGGLTMILIATVLEYLSLLVLKAHGKPLYFIVDRSADETILDYFRGKAG